MILIAGPCVIESDELLDIVASFMKNALTAYGDRIDYYFKASSFS